MAAERRAALLTRHGVEETKNGETADKYSRRNGMDKRNTTALHVLETQGSKAAIKHMFTDDKTGRELSYAEMRSRYG